LVELLGKAANNLGLTGGETSKFCFGHQKHLLEMLLVEMRLHKHLSKTGVHFGAQKS
jgi:hypothetical protein